MAEGKIFTYEKVTPSGKLSPALRDMIDVERIEWGWIGVESGELSVGREEEEEEVGRNRKIKILIWSPGRATELRDYGGLHISAHRDLSI